MSLKFYRCKTCGNIICMVEDSGMIPSCCTHQMSELRPGSTDGAIEKHVPVFETNEDSVYVRIGILPHPMEENHHINFIAVETNLGFHIRKLDCGHPAEASIKLSKYEKVLAVYEYCNLHGLFKAE